jgi:hypothetical protein
MMDIDTRIHQIQNRERAWFAAKIILGVFAFVVFCSVISISADREDKRMDIEIQNLQAQGYPVSR